MGHEYLPSLPCCDCGEKVKQVDRQWLLAGVYAKPGGEAGSLGGPLREVVM